MTINRLHSHWRRKLSAMSPYRGYWRALSLEKLECRRVLSSDLPSVVSSSAIAALPNAATVDAQWFASRAYKPGPSEATVLNYTPRVPTVINWQGKTAEAYAHEWIVQLSPATLERIHSVHEANESFAAAGLEVVEGTGRAGQLLVRAAGQNVAEASAALAGMVDVSAFEPNFVLRAEDLPNDPQFASLWGLHNIGELGRLADADIDVPEAWNVSTGSASVVVAVIDTGVDYNHPDLAANMWRNPGELANNGLDDDRNGFVDDVYGYDFVNDDGNPMDDQYHGTHVAGTIAAVGNNNIGVVGVNWTSSIMALKFLDSQGRGSTANAVRAVNYATMMRQSYGVNVRVTNNSWGGGARTQALDDAIIASGNAGILFVAAAGNSHNDNDASPTYPANVNAPNVVAVAATDAHDQLASFSNYGRSSVFIAAPGVDIYSTMPGGSYGQLSGTSMASPHVAGVAALAWSIDPNASIARVKDALSQGDSVASLSGVTVHGRLNAYSTALAMGLGAVSSSPANGALLSTLPRVFTVDFTDPYDPATVAASDLTVNGVPASSFAVVDVDTLRFTFPTSPVTSQGLQTMALAAGAVRRLSDHAALRGWQSKFYYDADPLVVVATTPSENQVLIVAPTELALQFNEAVQPLTVDASDLELDFGTVTAARAVDSTTVVYTISGLAMDAVVRFTLKSGALADSFGSPNVAYNGSFRVDDPLIDRWSATNLPLPIPSGTTTTSLITIHDSLTISDLDVDLSLLHPNVGDLALYLLSPDGTRVALVAEVSGQHLTGTVLDDEATRWLSGAQAPFTGRFKPVAPLSTFDGFNAQGDWRLEIVSAPGASGGTLLNWSLALARDLFAAPRISAVQPLPPEGSDTWKAVDTLTVRFSEVMDAATINNLANWKLISDGPDGVFDTADDVVHALRLPTAYVGGLTVPLQVLAGTLPAGRYWLSAKASMTDLLGNPLDGNGDSTGGDDYSRRFTIKPRVTTLPFVEGFEAGSLSQMAGYWEFRTGVAGRIVVDTTNGPAHSGQYHLLLDQYATDADSQTATLHVDLWNQTNVNLDFWQKTFSSTYDDEDDGVDISADGVTWFRVVNLTERNVDSFYQHHSVNLDAAIASAGIAFSRDFQIRFGQNNRLFSRGGFAFDDIRLSHNDVFGPRVVSMTPSGQSTVPLSSLTVTFNEPIAAASFTAADVTVLSATGATIAATPIDSGDHRTFVIQLAAGQFVGGSYSIRIGPNITDLAGNTMNQDGDSLPGETYLFDHDYFDTTIELGPTPAQTIPYVQTFESGEAGLTGWSFYPGTGKIEVSNLWPHGGSRGLQFSPYNVDVGTSREAVLKLNLASVALATDLTVDFWMRTETYTDSTVTIWVSDNGTTWKPVSGSISPSKSAHEHYVFDLDAATTAGGIALDSDVYVKITHQTPHAYRVLYLDDFRVSQSDLAGARVVAQTQNGRTVSLTFSEPIAALSAADLGMVTPNGLPLTLASGPTASADRRTFTFELPVAQAPNGVYRLNLGPNVLDLAGNKLDQDFDGISGESNGNDTYVSTFGLAPTPRAFPYFEDFESGDFAALTGWSFEQSIFGTVDLLGNAPAHSGSRQLTLEKPGGPGNSSATVVVDLSSQVGATNLEIDFWTQALSAVGPFNNMVVLVSGDGVNFASVPFSQVVILPTLNQFVHLGVDLDQMLNAAGIAFDEDVYIRIAHGGSGQNLNPGMTIDDVRISNADVFGPQSVTLTPAVTNSNLSSFTLTFNEPIDASSFTAADVSMITPTGGTVALAGNPIDSGDHRTFTINLAASQMARGTYTLRIGPDVADVAGNLINVDGDWYGGETNGEDVIVATIQFTSSAQTLPYNEDFESGSLANLAAWNFSATGTGNVSTVASTTFGAFQLKFDQTATEASTQEAVLRMDLTAHAGMSNLYLDFQQQALGSVSATNTLRVYLSGDGAAWTGVPEINGLIGFTGVLNQYRHLAIDLDSALAAAGIALDSTVFVRFVHAGANASTEMVLDNVRISQVDVIGPHVTSIAPATASTFSVTFDEPVAPSSFTASQVVLRGPTGSTVSLAGNPAPSADQRTYTLTVATPIAGTYNAQILASVTDLAGNPLNQNRDALNGDEYSGTVLLGPPVAQVLPVAQGFESNTFVGLPGWSFAVGPVATMTLTGASAPRGSWQLKFDQTSTATQEAVLLLDLANVVSATDLALDFYLKPLSGFGATNRLDVLLSGDGIDYKPLAPATGLQGVLLNQFSRYAFDLDVGLDQWAIARDSDVFIKFQHSGTTSTHQMTLDDVRVSQVDVLGPRVVSQTPSGRIAGPLQSFSVTFDEAIDSATFNAADVVVTSASGAILSLVGDPVDAGDQRTFNFSLATPSYIAGNYKVTIGPSVLDLAGNPMNQDADGLSGELGTQDTYILELTVAQAAPLSFPLVQDFESVDFTQLAGWSAAVTNGSIAVTTDNNPHSGSKHLKFDRTAAGVQSIGFVIDLLNQGGATNLSLDFWLQMPRVFQSHGLRLYASNDGLDFQLLEPARYSPSIEGQNTHFGFDLDVELATAGILLDKDVYFRFDHEGSLSLADMFLDDLRISNVDVLGPKILFDETTIPSAPQQASLTLKFDEPIDAASFTATDVQVRGPTGNVVLAQDPVDLGDHRTFLIRIPTTLFGQYTFTIGPHITDVAGNELNQNNDNVGGEIADTYAGAFTVAPPAPQAFPYLQSFESASLDSIAGWSYAVTAGSTIDLSQSDNPRGTSHLRMAQTAYSATHEAVLLLDLANQLGRTDLALDYWLQLISSSHTFYVSVSNNGFDYTLVLPTYVTTTSGQYLRYALDLDAALAEAGVVLDGDVYLKFTHTGTATLSATLDDVRVSSDDVIGPRVSSHAPSGSAAAPTGSFTVTFDEPIDAATFTAADVIVTGPLANLVQTSSPIDSGDHRTFTINLPISALLPGTYTLQIGPHVLDLAGNLMNQDADVLPGETGGPDTYTGTFTLTGATTQAFPHLLDFDSDLTGLAGWSFATTGTGKVGIATDSPLSGRYHLKFEQTSNLAATQEAILRVDLSGQAGATNLLLDFYARSNRTTNQTMQVLVSGDGSSWTLIPGGNIAPPTINLYAYYTFDLDQALAGIALDSDVYLKFVRSGTTSAGNFVLDDIRLKRGAAQTAPTLGATINTFSNGQEEVDYSITFEALAAAVAMADADGNPLVFRVEMVNSGVLRKNGMPIVPNVSTIGPGELVVWSPPTDGAGTLDAFTVRAWDGDLGSLNRAIAKVTLANSNDAPRLNTAVSVKLPALTQNPTTLPGVGISDLIDGLLPTQLITDPDPGALKGIAIVFADTTYGTWEYSAAGSPWTPLGTPTPTAARLLTRAAQNRIKFIPAPNFAGTISPVITFRAWDQTAGSNGETANVTLNGGATAFSAEVQSASITVTPVGQHAPILDNTGNMQLATIDEDDAGNSGTLVSQIIASAGGDRIFDQNSILEGLAIIGVDTGSGSWQYSTNNGTNWLPLGAPSADAARLLAANSSTRVRFVPPPNYAGLISAGITFRAWDQTAGTNGGTIAVTGVGGSTAFSDAIESASITVLPVPDAPTIASVTTLEDTLSGPIAITRYAADGEEITGFRIVAVAGGHLYKSDGLTPVAAGDLVNVSEGQDGLRFLPSLDSTASGQITVAAVAGARQSPMSISTVLVTPVNDAPLGLSVGNAALLEGVAGALVQSIVVQDPDAGDAHSFTVDDSRFQIVNGQLKLRDTVALDYEAEGSVSLIVTVTDDAGESAHQPLTLQVLNVNEAPVGLWLSGDRLVFNRGARLDVQIAVTVIDPDFGDTFSYSVSDPRLEIVDGVLRLSAARRYEFGGEASLPIVVTAIDGGGLTYSAMTIVHVSVENEAPSAIALVYSSVAEATFGATVGLLQVTDPDPGDLHHLTVSDPRFEVNAGTLRLKPDSRLDFEAEPSIGLRVIATDSAGAAFEQFMTLGVEDLPEAPTAWEVTRLTVFRDLPGAWIASFRLTDSDRANDYRFAVDDPRFEVRADQLLYLRPGESLIELAGERIPLTISIFDVAARTTVQAKLTLTAIDSPMDWSAAHQWRLDPVDVDADGYVTPLDAALLIAQLNASGPSNLTPASPGSVAAFFYDVSGDDVLSPLDALLVINRLNSRGAGEADDAYAHAVDSALQDQKSGATLAVESASDAALAMLWNMLDEQQTQKQRGR